MSTKKEKPPDNAQAAALRLLGRRDYSREEMRRKLAGRGFSPGETDGALEQFETRGLLDDRKLAHRLAGYYSREKLWGPQKIFQKLTQRGIPAGFIRDVIAAEEESGAVPERLRKALNQRMKGQDPGSLGPPEKRRLAAHFRQRGYAWDDIWEALQETGGSVEE